MSTGDELKNGKKAGPHFPILVLIACAIWILLGGVPLVWSGIDLWQALHRPHLASDTSYLYIELARGLLIPGVFLVAGIAPLFGKVKDTQANGSASIALGLFGGCLAFAQYVIAGLDTSRLFYYLAACSFALILAGTMAWVGRKQYQAWVIAKRGENAERPKT